MVDKINGGHKIGQHLTGSLMHFKVAGILVTATTDVDGGGAHAYDAAVDGAAVLASLQSNIEGSMATLYKTFSSRRTVVIVGNPVVVDGGDNTYTMDISIALEHNAIATLSNDVANFPTDLGWLGNALTTANGAAAFAEVITEEVNGDFNATVDLTGVTVTNPDYQLV